MVLTIDADVNVNRGYLRFPNHMYMRLVQEPFGEIWAYARDVFKVMEIDERRFFECLVEVAPELRAAMHPSVCGEKKWTNLVNITGMMDLAALAARQDTEALEEFKEDFIKAYNSADLLWEQGLFKEEDEIGSPCAVGE